MAKKNRYGKNLLIGGMTLSQQEDMLSSSVVVMGCGALGSGVIMNLCGMGVGKIKLIDSDTVEEDNFNSQLIHKEKNLGRAKVISAKDWIAEYNPDVKVEIDKVRLNEFNYFNTIQGYDIIIDCFNSLDSSYMLNEIALRHNKILIFGSALGYCGQVTTIVPKKTGCLNCVIKKSPLQGFEPPKEEFAKISSVVSAVSAIQAAEVLKVVAGVGEPLMNRLLTLDIQKGDFRTLNYSRNINCDVCSNLDNF